MKRDLIFLAAVILLAFGGVQLAPVHAQAPGPSLVYANGPVSGCPTLPIPNGGALVCIGSDHVVFAPAAATKYLQLDGQVAPPVAAGVTSLSINGSPAKTGAVSFSLSTPTTVTAQ